METTEASPFESSEMVATFLASTPLLSDSWKLCSHANATAPHGFVANRIGDVTSVAFSGVQMVPAAAAGGLEQSCCRNLVSLAAAADGLFPALQRRGEGEEPVMVHTGFLNLFLSVYNCPSFRNQMLEIMNNNKSVVFTGHSIGGALASLSALWLLSNLQSFPSPLSVLCITFGLPLLGNKSLSRAILQERWGGNFCHVIAKHDIVPRLLLAPLTPQLHTLLQFWHLSMTSPYLREAVQLNDNDKSELFHLVLACTEESAKAVEEPDMSMFWPFGNHMFCSEDGAICVDSATAVVKMLHLMLATGSASSSIDDHLRYEDYVGKVSMQFLKRRGFPEEEIPDSSYEAGIALALQSSGISNHDSVSEPAKDCLKMAKRMGRTPNLNSANLAIELSKINPLRAQIEWYKATCDDSRDQMGYYDTFKQRGASRRDSKVNMNRIKLAQFWTVLIEMLESNALPYDFHKREKWVYASQSYKLLVEPLDIAEYYRSGMHRTKGHYLKHGRDRMYEIFDRWWRDRRAVEEENDKRTKFASLTQDSCFWARVEEAREWLDNVRSESDARNLSLLWENIDKFEQYARRMVERKEVSKDVVAKNSSYSSWMENWNELKLQLQQFPTRFPSCLDGEVVP
ncbi:lipase-like PAD4 [Cornus florida]|uniref:lipase-like PAD4 n=1 Tax=Cornus florida TaxID=4283 RepID=UPI00289A8F7D|nr:lipase-like PAD4 [Cornus florida]